MPALKDPKHEAFVREYILTGKPLESYEKAGFKSSRTNAHRLLGKEHIRARIDEIQEMATKQTLVTVQDLTEKLMGLFESCAKDDKSTARQCLMDIAKLNGLIIDHSRVQAENVNYHISDQPMDKEDWESTFGAGQKKPGGGVGPH